MNKNKQLTIMDKCISYDCKKCSGTGFGDIKKIECHVCKGSGKIKESYYIYIDEKNKISVDSDCGA